MNRFILPLGTALCVAAASTAPANAAGGLADALPGPVAMPLSVAPAAARWAPAVIADPDAHVPPPPPVAGSAAAKAELAELVAWQRRRTADDVKAINYWSDGPIPMRWSEEVRAEIITASMVPPRGARALALVHAAMYDATLVAWRAKARYKRPVPAQEDPFLKPIAGEPGIPSYPSEHAAVSMAAAAVMAELFPDHAAQLKQKARLVGETRVAAGAVHRSDVTAGFAIGEAVAKEVLAKRWVDGSEQPNPPLAKVPGKWWVAEPMETGAGRWRTWLMRDGQQFRMTYDAKADIKDVAFAAGYKEVEKVHDKLTPHQIERAIYWNFDVPAILWNDIVRKEITDQQLDAPHTARMLNVLHMTLADAFIACWDTKYANRVPRPFMFSPAGKPLQTVVPTPPHPSWPSGHATASMAAAVVLAQYFPHEKARFEAQAREAAMSRLWGGIHFRKDNDDGLKLGERIGRHAVARARAKGWL